MMDAPVLAFRNKPPDNRNHRWGRLALVMILSWGIVSPALGQSALDPNPDFNKGGRTAFQFLKIGLGARQAAMGEASIAVVEDVNAAFWNPADISGIRNMEASFSYAKWLGDMNYVAGAVGLTRRGIGTFALSVASLDYGDIVEAVASKPGDARTGDMFTGGDFMLGLTYSRMFTDRLSIGGTAKYLHESLWNYGAGTFAFDVGTMYDLGFKGLHVAMAFQNFSGSVNWRDSLSDRVEGYDLPLVFRIGVSTALIGPDNAFINAGGGQHLVVSAEAINSNDYSERLHLGAEYTIADLISFRGGYRMNYAEGNWSVGAGLHPHVAGVDMRVDYAYVHYQFLDAPHRLTVSLAF